MHNHWDIKFNTIRRKDNKNREHKGTVLLCFFVFKTIINHFLYARSPLRVRISSVNNNKNPNGLDVYQFIQTKSHEAILHLTSSFFTITYYFKIGKIFQGIVKR